MASEDQDESSVIKAVSAVIPLGSSELDVYMLPSGEKRMGMESVGLALGYSERWFYNRTNRPSDWLKNLQANGFTGAQQELRIIRSESRGASIAKTIALRDFIKVVAFEAIALKNLNAIVLLASFAETGLEKIVDDVFAGRSIEFLLEKIVHFSKWTYEELQEVLAYNREEVKALYPWGYPDYLEDRFGSAPPSLEL
jgi:hypothetical protein